MVAKAPGSRINGVKRNSEISSAGSEHGAKGARVTGTTEKRK